MEIEDGNDDVEYLVNRQVFTTKKFLSQYQLQNDDKKSARRFSFKLSSRYLTKLFPILSWLPKYRIKDWILGDIFSGLTVGVVNIPQSLAFSILTGLAPVFGLYTSFFPVITYFFLGTSRHLSIGSFAVISLLTHSAVIRLAPDPTDPTLHHAFNNYSELLKFPFSNLTSLEMRRIEIATSISFLSGLIQFAIGLFRLGFILSLLSPAIIKSLTICSALYVMTSQFTAMLGIVIPNSSGLCQPVKDLIEIFKNIENTNVATITIGIISLIVLSLGRYINIRYKNKMKVPFPTEIFVVIISILSSYFGDFKNKYEVNIVDTIPMGFPKPQPTDLGLIKDIFFDAFSIAIISLAINVSLAKLYAERYEYEIDVNQELIAYGAANFFPSFFFCFPSAAALARCEILVNSGGKTQMVGFFSFMVLLLTIPFLGFVFEPLPRAILATIIIVGLYGILGQFKTIPNLYRKSKLDFIVWLVTFLAMMVFSIPIGLLIGVIFSNLCIVLQSQLAKSGQLKCVADTNIYVDANLKIKGEFMDQILIFKLHSNLFFANRNLFIKKLESQISETLKENRNMAFGEKDSHKYVKGPLKYIIIDCSSFTFLDLPSTEALLKLKQKYKLQEKSLILVNVANIVRNMLQINNYYQDDFDEFLTVHDAVVYCKSKLQQKTSLN